MDLGCLDMGCISVSDKKIDSEAVLDSENKGLDSVPESGSANSKIGQNKKMKENGQTSLNTVNKSGAQMKKPGHRRNSPVNWFPRKKVESYLTKKIQMLQEVSGMNLTLDETLGDSNPHYSKVLKEKMASREAANKAIEARKAALVEASWCRILQAARIKRKEAEEQLLKAEETAAKAFEAALAIGVNMYDIPNCPQKPNHHHNHQVEKCSSSKNQGVTACFETAFEVDKEVAASVKRALIRLTNESSSFQRDEFKDLLHKISQNPDTEEEQRRSQDSSSSSSSSPPKCEMKKSPESQTPVSQRSRKKGRNKKRQSLERRLADTMLFERLQSLKEDEISSLATIVATCGLSAALAEIKNERLEEKNHKPVTESDPPLPSLDKVLVRHVSRLEREVEEAKKKKSSGTKSSGQNSKQDSSEIPSLDKFLVKRESRLEREVQEANDRRRRQNRELVEGKENRVDPNSMNKKKETEQECESLDKVLVKHVSRLEREKMKFAGSEESEYTKSKKKKKNDQESEGFEGLDQILVKHKSRLEREKFVSLLSSQQQEEDKNQNNNNNKSVVVSRREERERELQQAWGGLGLGNSMIKPHLSKLEREKAAWIKAEEEERKQKPMVFSD